VGNKKHSEIPISPLGRGGSTGGGGTGFKGSLYGISSAKGKKKGEKKPVSLCGKVFILSRKREVKARYSQREGMALKGDTFREEKRDASKRCFKREKKENYLFIKGGVSRMPRGETKKGKRRKRT